MKDKRILITGGYGLAGSAVYNKFISEEYTNIYRFHSSEYDLTKDSDTKNLIKWIKPQIILHFAAAVGGIMANKLQPADFLYKNTLMNLNVLEQGKNCEKICLTSSGCVYPEQALNPLNEQDLWKGIPEENTRAYGLSKRMLTIQSEAYKKQYNLNSFVIIPTNLFGPGDNYHPLYSHVIAGIINKIYTAKQEDKEYVTLWGDGTATRDFLYIKDFANVVFKLILLQTDINYVNLGTGIETPINKIANIIQQVLNYDGKIRWDTDKPNGQQRRYFDISYLKKLIGEYKFIPIEVALEETIKRLGD